jgi:CAAX prenyl protease-like protein
MLFIAFAVPIADGLSQQGVDARWIYAARTTVVCLLLLAFWKSYSDLRLPDRIEVRDLVFVVGAGVAVFVVWINLDFGWATFGNSAGFDPTRSDGSMDWTLIAFRMFGLALVVPVMEELFWRSYLLRWIQQQDFLALDPQKIGLRANLICAALFASEHSLWLAGLIAGLVYNFIYMRTRNLWMPIISHATTNAVLGVWILATGNWQFW